MATLVVNAGSSSHKLVLFDDDGRRRWSGAIDWSDRGGALAQDQEQLARALAPLLADATAAAITPGPIAAVGHRIVHGGDRFRSAVVLDDAVTGALEALRRLAPLHNGPALDTLAVLRQLLPTAWHAAAFDTAFHRSLPPEAATYALPAAWRDRGLHRFGFHGLSHGAIARRWPDARLISAHLGGGCSLAVIEGGRCRDTTMGFTPLDGLVMGTRSGSLDPGLLLELLEQGVSVAELREGLHRHSGLLGLSEHSSDMRLLRQRAQAGDGPARLAIDVFQHQLLKAIGAGIALLGGFDVLALTGGIGEHDGELHDWLQQRLQGLGLAPAGPARLEVVPADEEGEILRQLRALAPPPPGRPGG
ncbi:MAG: acetate/propionate family kinase [Synechococcus sp.]